MSSKKQIDVSSFYHIETKQTASSEKIILTIFDLMNSIKGEVAIDFEIAEKVASEILKAAGIARKNCKCRPLCEGDDDHVY